MIELNNMMLTPFLLMLMTELLAYLMQIQPRLMATVWMSDSKDDNIDNDYAVLTATMEPNKKYFNETLFLYHYTNFDEKSPYQTQVGVNLKRKSVVIRGVGARKFMHFEFMDTAINQEFHSLTTSYYRKTIGVLLLFDATQKNIVEDAAEWIDQQRNCSKCKFPDIQMYIKNQTILNEIHEFLTNNHDREMAITNNLTYYDSNAGPGLNICEAIESLLCRILKLMEKTAQNVKAKNDERGCPPSIDYHTVMPTVFLNAPKNVVKVPHLNHYPRMQLLTKDNGNNTKCKI